MAEPMPPIPIVLVTGFLGSGKTTLLRRWMRTHAQRRIAYLVNEFSATDVDGVILEADDDKIVAVPGGSIFCTCLVSEFIARLKSLHERHHTQEAPLELLVIEASGMANPRVMDDMLRDTKLDAFYDLRCVLTLVSPQTLPKLVVTLPNVIAQVEAADLVVLNRIDTATDDQRKTARALIEKLAPDAPVQETSFADVELDELPTGGTRERHGEFAKCRDPNYVTTGVAINGRPPLEHLLDALRAAAPALYRAKGIIETREGRMVVELADGLVTVEPTRLSPTANLVLIAPGTSDIDSIVGSLTTTNFQP